MKALLPGLGTALLAAAVLLTLALALTTKLFTLRTPAGPDAMGTVVVLFLPAIAWLLVLAAAAVALARGAFGWVSASPGVPGLAALGTVVGLGLLSVGAAVFSLEVRYASRTLVGLAGGLALPLASVAFLGFLLWSSPERVAAARWLRPCGAAAAALGGLACLGGLGLLVASSAESARQADEGRRQDEARWAQIRAENAERERRQAEELAALPDDVPIEVFLSHLFIDRSEEHHRRAVERIRALSGLTSRLAARLESPEPIEREHVLNFVRMAGTPDPAWEPLVRQALVRLAADYRAEAKDLSIGRITHVKGLAWGALLAAERFGPGRFVPEARELRAAVAAWPNEGPRADALAVVDLYLEGKPLPG